MFPTTIINRFEQVFIPAAQESFEGALANARFAITAAAFDLLIDESDVLDVYPHHEPNPIPVRW